MKSLKYLIVVLSLLIPLSLYAQADQEGVETVVSSFVKSIDTNNSDALSKIVVPGGSIMVINEFKKDVEHYSTDELVNMVKNKKAGGWTRNLDISSVSVDGNTAVAKIVITDARIKQTGYLTLIKNNGSWKIAGQITTLGSNKS